MSGIDIQYGFNSTLSNTINSLNVLQTLTENPGVSSCRVEDIVLDNSNKELFAEACHKGIIIILFNNNSIYSSIEFA